jgi:cobaltochelatase CobS
MSDVSEKITCQICAAKTHAIESHIKQEHLGDGWTLEKYKADYPDAPLLSKAAIERIKAKQATAATTPAPAPSADGRTKQPMHEVFGLGSAPAAKTARGNPIMIDVLDQHEFQDYVPEKDPNYVYAIDTLKNALIGVQLSIPAYTWGHMGSGKSTLWKQICAHLNRAMVRVQHTVNMEESHVLGEWRVKNGDTVFEPGWLPLAMRNGWCYLADEYDFGTPHVLSLYQPVLEGEPLVIKDASPEWRVVKPHKDFRFFATGNTNGVGDETGLYQGTQIQNAANYERFGIVMKVEYMPREVEQNILQMRCNLGTRDAENMIEFATKIRSEKTISMPISPRSLIRASQLGILKSNFREGLSLAYINRLPAIERETASQLAQRVFG